MKKRKQEKWVVFQYYHYNRTGSHKRYSYIIQSAFDKYLANKNDDDDGEYKIIYRADSREEASQYYNDIQELKQP